MKDSQPLKQLPKYDIKLGALILLAVLALTLAYILKSTQ